MNPDQVVLWLRRLVIGFTFSVHIQFAAFASGAMLIGAILLLSHTLSKRDDFNRLSRWTVGSVALTFSFGSMVAIVAMVLLTMVWPVFWVNLFHITFWPFFIEAITFVLMVAILFSWYFAWDRWARYPVVFVPLGLLLIVVTQWQQVMIDMVAAYMLTPVSPTNLLAVMLNTTTTPLDLHRFVGNISWAGFALAGASAVAYLRARTDERRRYWDWAGNVAFLFGIGLLFLQPAIGTEYVVEIRLHSPGAFDRMMRGELSSAFLLMSAFVGALFVLSGWYMWQRIKLERRQGRSTMLILLGLLMASALLLIVPRFIGPSLLGRWVSWLNPAGSFNPWKYAALAGLSSFGMIITAVYLLGLKKMEERVQPRRSTQWLLIALAIIASMQMYTMGFIRENGRSPYLTYGEMPRNEIQTFPLPPGPTLTPSP